MNVPGSAAIALCALASSATSEPSPLYGNVQAAELCADAVLSLRKLGQIIEKHNDVPLSATDLSEDYTVRVDAVLKNIGKLSIIASEDVLRALDGGEDKLGEAVRGGLFLLHVGENSERFASDYRKFAPGSRLVEFFDQTATQVSARCRDDFWGTS